MEDTYDFEEYEARPLPKEIEAFVLDVLSPDEIIADARVEVTIAGTYDKDGTILPHGLLDLRMGAFERYICNVCNETRQKCPGHFGFIKLHTPVYHEYFITKVRDILSCCCFHCGALKIHWQELIAKEKNTKTRNYFSQLRDGVLDEAAMTRGHLTMMKGFVKNNHFCANCKKTNPVKLTRKGPFLHTEYVIKKTGQLLQTHVTETKNDDILLPSKAYEILCKITDLDCRRLGLLFRPEWLMICVLRVLPICDRPSIYTSGRHSEDELTRKYMEILRENKNLQDISPSSQERLGLEQSLQEHVTHFFTSKYVQSQHRSTNTKSRRPYQAIKSLDTRLRGKKGRFRQNIMGKRVNFTARTVITGDPTLDNDQIGIPMSVAMDLTYTERVTQHNLLKLTEMVNNGPYKYPGATKVSKNDKQYDLRYRQKDPLVGGYLTIGDEVDRHLLDNDLVVFNRHPSLHKVSLMAHRIVVMSHSSFRMNLSPTAAYNADFDGDEMNIHVPQNEMARAELSTIMHVVNNNVTPQASRPILGIVQEATIGLYLITSDDAILTVAEAFQLLMTLRYIDNLKRTAFVTRVNSSSTDNGIHGRSIFSLLLPDDFDWLKGDVLIKDGQLVKGQISKKHMGAVINGIIHTIYTEYGAQRAHDFTSDAQRLAVEYVSQRGFSVGIGDCITKDVAVKKIKNDIDETIANVPSVLNNAVDDVNAMIDLQNLMERCGHEASQHLSKKNNMLVMIQSGSKGSITNITQMSGTVGQQKLLGRRIEDQYKDRTLPYYKRYDHGCAAKGYVRSSYIQGLTMEEYNFHMMGGREGLIDTACKSITGDTRIIIVENGECKCVAIGDWIDELLDTHAGSVTYEQNANMESLDLPNPVHIPTTDEHGIVSWAEMTHVTRHDPGEFLFQVETIGGRNVTVVESKSLIVWDSDRQGFYEKPSSELKVGDYLPVTANLPQPPLQTVDTIDMKCFISPKISIYGTEFHKAIASYANKPKNLTNSKWFSANNGSTFTLPYRSVRHCMKQQSVVAGRIYGLCAGDRSRHFFPETFSLSRRNGCFIGIYLAEGNTCFNRNTQSSAMVNITSSDDDILQFVNSWFSEHGIKSTVRERVMPLGVTKTIRGSSTTLARFLDGLVGHGAANKFIPAEFLNAPEDFILGLLDGYLCGDGHVGERSFVSSSVSAKLTEGISLLYARLGVFGNVSVRKYKPSNNLGTQNIKDGHVITVSSIWANKLKQKLGSFVLGRKSTQMLKMRCSDQHVNYASKNDVVLDKVKSIQISRSGDGQKVYDVTVPKTLNFMLANGLQVRDTAQCGYVTRKLIKALENVKVSYNGLVLNAPGEVLQVAYGDDGIDPTKLHSVTIRLIHATLDEITAWSDGSTTLLRKYSQLQADLQQQFYSRQKGQSTWYLPLDVARHIRKVIKKQTQNSSVVVNDQREDYYRVFYDLISGLKKYPIMQALFMVEARPSIFMQAQCTSGQYQKCLEEMCELLMRCQVSPGEAVGNLVAQSIGEPTMQMLLNSLDKNTVIMLRIGAQDASLDVTTMGKFIDAHFEYLKQHHPSKIENHGRGCQLGYLVDQSSPVYIQAGQQYGDVSWQRITAVTRHPVINEDGSNTILRVKLASGRYVTGTRAKSFVLVQNGELVPTNGSDIKVGDTMATSKKLIDLTGVARSTNLRLKDYLSPKRYTYSNHVFKVIEESKGQISNVRNKSGVEPSVLLKARAEGYDVPVYDFLSFRRRFSPNTHGGRKSLATMKPGCVYGHFIDNSHIPETIELDFDFGWLCGIYAAEGSPGGRDHTKYVLQIAGQQVSVQENVKRIGAKWGIHGHVCGTNKTWTGLNSVILTDLFVRLFGHCAENKFIHPDLLSAPDEWVSGFLSGYFDGDGHYGSSFISATSVSKRLIADICVLSSRFNAHARLSTSKGFHYAYPNTCNEKYNLRLNQREVNLLKPYLKPVIPYKQLALSKIGPKTNAAYITLNDIIHDKIVSIEQVECNEFVYDFTVDGYKTFNTYDGIVCYDTFHLAGMGNKTTTMGIPRLLELLNDVKTLKSPSMTIYLDENCKANKQKAEEVAACIKWQQLQSIVLHYEVMYSTTDAPHQLSWFGIWQDIYADTIEMDWFKNERYRSFYLKYTLHNDAKDHVTDISQRIMNQFPGTFAVASTNLPCEILVFMMKPDKPQDNDGEFEYMRYLGGNIPALITYNGIEGIKDVFISPLTSHDGSIEYVLETDGINMTQLYLNEDIDPYRTTCNDPNMMLQRFGVESAAKTIYREIDAVLQTASLVNPRHVQLLVHHMTHNGAISAINRHGFDRLQNIGVLEKASFEKGDTILCTGALEKKRDSLQGISGQIALGKLIKMGTGYFDVRLDIDHLKSRTQSTDDEFIPSY